MGGNFQYFDINKTILWNGLALQTIKKFSFYGAFLEFKTNFAPEIIKEPTINSKKNQRFLSSVKIIRNRHNRFFLVLNLNIFYHNKSILAFKKI